MARQLPIPTAEMLSRAPSAQPQPRLGFLLSYKDHRMAELIWLIIVLLLAFALGWAARSHISRRRRAAERKRLQPHQRKDGHLSNPSTTHAEAVRLYQKLN